MDIQAVRNLLGAMLGAQPTPLALMEKAQQANKTLTQLADDLNAPTIVLRRDIPTSELAAYVAATGVMVALKKAAGLYPGTIPNAQLPDEVLDLIRQFVEVLSHTRVIASIDPNEPTWVQFLAGIDALIAAGLVSASHKDAIEAMAITTTSPARQAGLEVVSQRAVERALLTD